MVSLASLLVLAALLVVISPAPSNAGQSTLFYTRVEYFTSPLGSAPAVNDRVAFEQIDSPPGPTSGYGAKVDLYSHTLHTDSHEFVGRLATVRVNPQVMFSSLSAMDKEEGTLYFIPTPAYPSHAGDSAVQNAILDGAGRNQLTVMNVYEREPRRRVQIKTSETLWCVAWDSIKKRLVGVGSEHVLTIDVHTGEVTTYGNPWEDDFGDVFAHPSDGLCDYDSASNSLFFVGYPSQVASGDGCEMIGRVPVGVHSAVDWGLCLDYHVLDMAVDSQLRTIAVVGQPSDGQSARIYAVNPYTSSSMQIGTLPSGHVPLRSGAFDRDRHMLHVFQPADTGFDSHGKVGPSNRVSYTLAAGGVADSSKSTVYSSVYGGVLKHFGFDVSARVQRFYKDTAARELLGLAAARKLRGSNFHVIRFNDNAWRLAASRCSGFIASTCYAKLGFAISANTTYDGNRRMLCPTGYSVATTCEVDAILTNQLCSEKVTDGQCDFVAGKWFNAGEQQHRWFFTSDTEKSFKVVDGTIALEAPSFVSGRSLKQQDFGGMVCRKRYGSIFRSNDWMAMSDRCGGFRQSTCLPRVRFALSKSSSWSMGSEYKCPDGYRWMTTCEAKATMVGGCTEDVYTNTQCGTNPSSNLFRFADSRDTMYGLAANSKHIISYSTSTSNFAGIVCVRDDPVSDPFPKAF